MSSHRPSNPPSDLYRAHIATRQPLAENALDGLPWDGIVLHSGELDHYFADDQHVRFVSTPHFAHWVPLQGPGHVLLIRPGERPMLTRRTPRDFWYEHAPLGSPFWLEAFDFTEAPTVEGALESLPRNARLAHIGPAACLRRAGVEAHASNPSRLVARLDWDRSYKTAYEIACIESATHAAASAHRGARAAFEDGASELQIHHAYMQALEATDDELPYPSIIAMNEKAAYLHYLGKRRVTDGDVVLIDSGAAHLGYACDITRTWTRPGTDPVFVELVAALNRVQQALCAAVEPGLAAVDLHRLADRLIADALHEADLIAVGGEEAVGRALTRAFFPHGFGHPLGLQVHDVAGAPGDSRRRRATPATRLPEPTHHPHLRPGPGVHGGARHLLHRDAARALPRRPRCRRVQLVAHRHLDRARRRAHRR